MNTVTEMAFSAATCVNSKNPNGAQTFNPIHWTVQELVLAKTRASRAKEY